LGYGRFAKLMVMPSSVIRAFHYDPVHRSLDITFVSGRQYRYLEVPESLHAAFRAAFSKGEFFNRHIREHFDFVARR
jgi:hypothetical protein